MSLAVILATIKLFKTQLSLEMQSYCTLDPQFIYHMLETSRHLEAILWRVWGNVRGSIIWYV